MCVFLYLVISTSGTQFLVEYTILGKIIKSTLGKIWGFHSGVKKYSQKTGLGSNSGSGTIGIMFAIVGQEWICYISFNVNPNVTFHQNMFIVLNIRNAGRWIHYFVLISCTVCRGYTHTHTHTHTHIYICIIYI